MRLCPARLAVLGLAALALAPAGASAAERYVAIPGVNGPGPARYDRSYVLKAGPERARTVLVLVPGVVGGAGGFRNVIGQLAARVPGLQVWGVDRRSSGLEDMTGYRTGDPAKASAYYLGGATIGGRRFAPVRGADVPFVREWGLPTILGDLRRTVLAARKGGRRVILGGYSQGASVVSAYASWDFGGHAGYRDADALMLIDGIATERPPAPAAIRRELADIRNPASTPFLGLVPGVPPHLAQLFIGLSALYAQKEPNAPAALQGAVRALLPAATAPYPLTNAALLGYAIDQDTGPAALRLLRFNGGSIDRGHSPARWRDGGLSPLRNLAAMLGGVPDFYDTYFPRRLSLDLQAVRDLRPSAATRLLGLRPFHTAAIDRPLYVFQSNLTHGRVLRRARAFVRRTRIGRSASATYVSDRRQNHLDWLTATPAKNTFLKTAVPFLRRAVRGR